MPIVTICRKPGCNRLTEPEHKYCPRHQALEGQQRRIFTKRTRSNEWHHLYNSTEWRRRSRGFLTAHPYCCRCGKPARIADHIIPHRGDRALFNDPSNLQPLCWSCHSAKTLRENRNFNTPSDAREGLKFQSSDDLI